MSTHEHTPDELMHALQVIRSECRTHPESCTECPLSFNDGGPIRLLNGTFHPHSVGRRSRMKQGGRNHDDQGSSGTDRR